MDRTTGPNPAGSEVSIGGTSIAQFQRLFTAHR